MRVVAPQLTTKISIPEVGHYVPTLFVEPRDPMLPLGLASSVYALSGSNLEYLSGPVNITTRPTSAAIYPNPASSSSLGILSVGRSL